MGGPAAATEESVAELRLRLYRPDPPPGAVAAYLEALAVLPPAPEPVLPRLRRPPRRPPSLRAIAVVLAVAAAAAGGIALAADGNRAAVEADRADRAAQAVQAAAILLPNAVGTPIGVLAGSRDGAARFVADGHRVVVSINCTGSGTIALRIGPEDPVVLTCGNGGPALALIPSTGALDRFVVRVEPDPAMPWALAVGALPEA
ncbi:hypothetical protein [Amnibacterium setariae]|uniref:Uncharacterized protein n=1 Tax=Amnibacterium setariae TaxID=2306585 RepID=A0A3A1U2F2_9MICO|nr:hypothetical protein [Amnibacterium setariae]RIX28037.1 hypothetical protein D1781_11065 [Amnibacterium setariae]